MVISKNSQLGLMMDDIEIQSEYLHIMLDTLDERIAILDSVLEINKNNPDKEFIEVENEVQGDYITNLIDNKQIDARINEGIGEHISGNLISNTNSKLYLICDGVEKCSKMIKVGDNFSSRALKNIQFGNHTYLLGKDEMTRFICAKGYIKGVYWCRSKKIAFEYGFDLNNGGYFFHEKYEQEFTKVAKIMTFVELGDIEVLMLEKGRNNNKSKKDGKITNTSNYTVYVVDSSWNKLIIRTAGFAVMGHFRLQSCGINHADRKLIWINAFEKHGYKRLPKASILNN